MSRWHQSRDIRNHLKCYVRHVQRSVPSETVTGSNDECAFAVCAVIEFVAILRSMQFEGQILSIGTVCSIYEQVMVCSCTEHVL